MPRGASEKREREYEELKHKFQRNGRYKGREEEVAARIVNKQRAQYGETKKAKKKEKEGKAPDKNLPIDRYRHLKISEIENRLQSLSDAQVKKVRRYEKEHKNRKTLLEKIDRQLAA